MRLGRVVEVVVSVGVGLALLVVGVLYQGVPAAQVVLNDGGVWVVNTQARLVGHLNAQSRTLDGGLKALDSVFDLLQAGPSVLIDNRGSRSLQRVDPSTVAITGQLDRQSLHASHGGGRLVVSDPVEGSVWAMGVDGLAGFDVSQDPIVTDEPGVVGVMTLGGMGYAVAPDGSMRSLTWSDVDGWVVGDGGSLAASVPEGAELTAVGDVVVAFDRESGRLITPSAEMRVAGAESVVVQPPGPAGHVVLVAAGSELRSYPLDGGEPERVAVGVSGEPAAPVFHEGCRYGVWSGSGAFVRDCPGDADDVNRVYPDLVGARDLSFRTNRRVIVVNDNVTGDVYLPSDGMSVVNNWDVVKSQVEEEEDDEATDGDLDEAVAPDFTEDQHPPTANPDEFGARAGAATTLPVLANDTDPDGDVLTAVLEQVPEGVSVIPTKGARGLRVDLPAEASGSFSFTYRADDGQERSSPATVTVRVVPVGSNEAPTQVRTARLAVAERAQVTYSVLPDWFDPDGDQIFLRKAVGPDGLKVTYRQDGTLTVKDLGTAGPGLREISVVVSDGELDTEGVVRVQVSPKGVNVPPIANADHYWGSVGESIRVEPLSNDTDPNGDELSLTWVGDSSIGTSVTPDYAGGFFQFTAENAGMYFVQYWVSDGVSRSMNEVRIDVIDPAGKNDPPVAENDLSLLPEGSAAMVDVLANDSDPLGGVLVIQGVSVPESSGLTVEVVNRAQLRISAPAGLPGPTPFTYTISNGYASAVGTVMVLPETATGNTLPPVAVDDEALVRAGDIVTVRVLANDYSPTNMQLKVLGSVEVNSATDVGEAFVSGDVLRFRAGGEPGQARVTYTIEDSAGNVDSAEVRVGVVAFDKENQLPQPRPLEARVVAGNTVNITVPLDGVDPDGDSVQVVGLGDSPELGQAEIERGYIAYTAPEGAFGTDTFTYKVRDRFGGEGSAQVRVGIAPAVGVNQNPVAVADNTAARPGAEIEVDVTANDIDPDGDDVTLVDGSVEPVDDRTNAVTSLNGQRVRITTPEQPGMLQFYYRVVDGQGGSARGVITVLVDEQVPPVAPIAVDDPLTSEDIKGLSEVSVDVLTNDSDPDGSTGKLTVSVESPARVAGEQVVVPVAQDRQVVLYTITDPDGLSAKAAVIVPGAEQTPPTLNPELVPAKVKGGDTLEIDLDEYVMTRAGHRAVLTSATKVSAGTGGDGADLVTGDRSLAFTPEASFIGETFVSFEVTDGETIEDPRGLKATLQLPIVVESSGLFPPVFKPSEIAVAPGEAPEQFDVGAMVTDPDPGDQAKLSFRAGTATSGFEVSVEGQKLVVSAPADTPVGTTGSVEVTVTDGSTDPVTATVPLRVITSTRPLITTRDAEITEARSGETSSIDLDSYVTNPFADRGGVVSLAGAPTVSPAGSGTVTGSGLSLSITPAAEFDGQMVVTYQVQDATKDASRFVTGVVRATVKGQPRAPENVEAVTNASKSATVTWSAGDLRGGTLTGFTVYWDGGSKDCGRVTVCELTRLLENNRDYTFTVTETTEVGESARSAPSNVVRPDVKPNPPSVPVATFGDTSIALKWADGGVPDGGSPVDRYTVSIRPAAGGITQKEVTGTSLTWSGLANGTAYEFQVVAHNQFEHPSDPSGWSSPPEIPAGKPGPPAAPHVDKDPVSTAAPRATVTWSPPAFSNGDTSFTYELRRTGTTTVIYSGSATSTAVTMAVDTHDQSFEVRVTNKSRKWSDWSPASNAVRAFQPPGRPGGFSLTPTGANNTARANFTSAAGNGATSAEIRYQWLAGGASGWVTPGQSITTGAFPNGTTVTVRLRAVSSVNGETAQGPFTTATVNTYGPPRAPAVNAQGHVNNVTLNWNGASTANGRRITAIQVDTSDWNGTTSTLSGSRNEGNGRNQRKCVRARTRDSTGLWGSWSGNSCANTWPSPTAVTTDSGATWNGLQILNLTLRNWNPNSNVYCFMGALGGYQDFSATIRVNGGGDWGPDSPQGPVGKPVAASYLIRPDLISCEQR
ncbi:MAG: hypothetical protein CSA84_00885 [Actinomycetales bacterium]|nr:MAG: hypothetical protein CSA84_00885 [Actinomycetales bacterium]